MIRSVDEKVYFKTYSTSQSNVLDDPKPYPKET